MPYTRTDLIIRVLARLGETGFDHVAETADAAASATYTRDDLVERILHRLRDAGYAETARAGTVTAAQVVRRALNILGDAGYEDATPAGTYTAAQIIDRILAMLGEAGFDVPGPAPSAATFGWDDLVLRALTRLGEIGFGQTAEPEAAERVRTALPAIFSELVATRVYLPIGTVIEPAAMDALSAVVASKLSSDFPLGADEIALLAARAQAAQDVLRRLIFGHQKRVADALPGIRAELRRARVYSSATSDPLPRMAGDALAAIAASRLAGEFGLPLDRATALQTAAQAAEARLSRLDIAPVERVSTALPGIRSELYAGRVYSQALTEPLPGAAADALAAIVAARLAPDLGAPAEATTVLLAAVPGAEARLRRLDVKPRDRVTKALPGILADLAGQRIYIGTSSGVEDGAIDALSAIAASRMVDDFDLDAPRAQMLMAAAQAGETSLRRARFGFWERVAHGLPGIFAELYDDGVYAFPLDDTIKPAAFDALSAIVASRLIDDFQTPPDRAQMLLVEARSGEMKLRRLKAEPYVSTPQPVCYF